MDWEWWWIQVLKGLVPVEVYNRARRAEAIRVSNESGRGARGDGAADSTDVSR